MFGGLVYMVEWDVDWEGIKEVFEDFGMGFEFLFIDGWDICCLFFDGLIGFERLEILGVVSLVLVLGGFLLFFFGWLIFFVNDVLVWVGNLLLLVLCIWGGFVDVDGYLLYVLFILILVLEIDLLV